MLSSEGLHILYLQSKHILTIEEPTKVGFFILKQLVD
jgi:hypothetical protein